MTRHDPKSKQPAEAGADGFLPLSPMAFHILLALLDGERHGYGLMQDVELRTKGAVRLGAGTLYGALKRMLKDRLVEESGESVDPVLSDERRRYYRITTLGSAVVRADARRLAQLVRFARSKRLLGPEIA